MQLKKFPEKRVLVLASASPRRRELMQQAGLCPHIIKSGADEDEDIRNPEELVLSLSEKKAMDVAEKAETAALCAGLADENGVVPAALVVGADTVVFAGGRILGKPADEKEAFSFLKLLQGEKHSVITGVTLIDCKRSEKISFAVSTDVYVYPMTDEDIWEYIGTGEPMDKAGAYGIQGRFAAYIEKTDGDFYSVVGLPVGRLCRELSGHHYTFI